MSRSGVSRSSEGEVGFVVVALHAPTEVSPIVPADERYATNVAAVMVVASSLDGIQAATELALSVASSCLRDPATAVAQPAVAADGASLRR